MSSLRLALKQSLAETSHPLHRPARKGSREVGECVEGREIETNPPAAQDARGADGGYEVEMSSSDDDKSVKSSESQPSPVMARSRIRGKAPPTITEDDDASDGPKESSAEVKQSDKASVGRSRSNTLDSPVFVRPMKRPKRQVIHDDSAQETEEESQCSSKVGPKADGTSVGGPDVSQQQKRAPPVHKKYRKNCPFAPKPSNAVLQWVSSMVQSEQRRHVKVGHRVKVQFDLGETKKSGNKKLRWYGGVITEVYPNGKRVRIVYDDGSHDVFKFPDVDIIVDATGNGEHAEDTGKDDPNLNVFVPRDDGPAPEVLSSMDSQQPRPVAEPVEVDKQPERKPKKKKRKRLLDRANAEMEERRGSQTSSEMTDRSSMVKEEVMTPQVPPASPNSVNGKKKKKLRLKISASGSEVARRSPTDGVKSPVARSEANTSLTLPKLEKLHVAPEQETKPASVESEAPSTPRPRIKIDAADVRQSSAPDSSSKYERKVQEMELSSIKMALDQQGPKKKAPQKSPESCRIVIAKKPPTANEAMPALPFDPEPPTILSPGSQKSGVVPSSGRKRKKEAGVEACKPKKKRKDRAEAPMKNGALAGDNWVRCDRCEKWRLLPDDVQSDDLPERWFCELNKYDPKRNSCDVPEQKAIMAPKVTPKKRRRKTGRGPATDGVELPEVPLLAAPVEEPKTVATKKSPADSAPTTNEAEQVESSKGKKPKTEAGGSDASGEDDAGEQRSRPRTRRDAEKEGSDSSSKEDKGKKVKDPADSQEWVQCEKCHKWRRLPPRIKPESLPDEWFCSMNDWDIKMAACAAPEDQAEPLPRDKAILAGESTKGSSNTLTYRNLIFGNGARRLVRPTSERARAADSIFISPPTDGPPTVQYANSSCFVNRGAQRFKSESCVGGVLSLLSETDHWNTSETRVTDSIKALVYHAISDRMFSPCELLLETQCRRWYDVDWESLRASLTIQSVEATLQQLMEDGLLQTVEFQASQTRIVRYKRVANPPIAKTRCIKLAKPWKAICRKNDWSGTEQECDDLLRQARKRYDFLNIQLGPEVSAVTPTLD